MARRLKIDLSGVSFPFTTEYSIDGGANWINKAVNEEYVIPYDSIVEPTKKIMIRSDSQDATALTRDNLNLDEISYGDIIVKNGKLIESMESLFSGAFLGNVKISGVPALKNIRKIASSSIFNDFNIEPLPKCEDAYYAFKGSLGSNIGNITLGADAGATIGLNASGLFRESVFDSIGSTTIDNAIVVAFPTYNTRINVMGHLDIQYATPSTPALAAFDANGSSHKGEAITDQSVGLYYYTDFDVCPSLRAVGHNSSSVATGTENADFLGGFARKSSASDAQRETYFPSCDIISISEFTDSSSYLGNSFLAYNNSPLKFGGISVSYIGLKSSSYAFIYSTSNSSSTNRDNPLRLFSSFKSLSELSYDTSGGIGKFLEQNEFSGKTFYSNPNWFPSHEILYSGKANNNNTSDTIGYMAFKRRYARIDKIGNDIVITKNIRIQPLDECSFIGDTITINNSSYLIGNSQGSYCYNNSNNDGCVFVSSDGVTTQAIAGVSVSNRAMLSSDEKWLYILTTESIDTDGTTGQNITQIIHKYSVADGTLAEDIIINNLPDTHVRLFYKAFDDYELKVIIDKYYIDADGDYVKEGSYLTSISDDGVINTGLKEAPASSPIDTVFHHYAETFEFSGVHLASGSLTRMIGK